MTTRSLEEGAGADNDPQRAQRPTQRRAATITAARHGSSTRSHTDSPPPPHPAGSSINYPPPPPSTSRFAFLSSPYFALLVTLVLFLVVLSASSYIFLRLQRQHPDHLFTPASTTLTPLLSQHPAYQQLQRELAGQYQQMLTLAKQYMNEDQWREFQAEAVRIDSTAAVRELQQQAAAVPASSCAPCPVCSTSAMTSAASSRLSELTGQTIMTDWSVNSTAPLSATDLYLTPTHSTSSHDHTWTYCPTTPITTIPHLPPYKLCDIADFRREQWYQKQQFVIPIDPTTPIEKPRAPQCVWPPPADYVRPAKHKALPAIAIAGSSNVTGNNDWVRWSNHFVMNDYNLSQFNYGYGKNLYHFNAPHYDNEQLSKLDRIAAHLPLGTHIRNALDVGAGGGSLSLLLHRRYNILTLNLVYAELPYCEYITERGGLCAHITAFYSMPFAKFSFDLIHIAWLFHMFNGANLIEKLMEVHRVLRPGGYLWWEGGFSYAQRDDVKGWAAALGYVVVWEESVDRFDKTMFGSEPHQCDFTAVFRKASRGVVQCGERKSEAVLVEDGGGASAAAADKPGGR